MAASLLWCPCEYAAYVPAVFGPSFNSSTEWWTFQLHADVGTHSAHCGADRGLSQVQFLAGCGRGCCCAMTGARRKLWSLRSCSGFGRRPFLGQGRCARWCNDWERAMLGSTVDTCLLCPGWLLGDFFTNFLVTGWTRILRSILDVPCSHG